VEKDIYMYICFIDKSFRATAGRKTLFFTANIAIIICFHYSFGLAPKENKTSFCKIL